MKKPDDIDFDPQHYLEAQRFLDTIDPDATGFTFQSFDDDKERCKRKTKTDNLGRKKKGYDPIRQGVKWHAQAALQNTAPPQ